MSDASIQSDDQLQAILRLADFDPQVGLGVKLKLLVDGTVLEGVVVSHQQYREMERKELRDRVEGLRNRLAVSGRLAQSELLAPLTERFGKPVSTMGREPTTIEFVGLRDVTIYGPGGETQLPLMRVRVSRIAGWSLLNRLVVEGETE